MPRRLLFAVLGCLAGAGCLPQFTDFEGKACDAAHGCGDVLRCIRGACVVPPELPEGHWSQAVHGFASTQACPSCSAQVHVESGNLLAASIAGPTPLDRARAEIPPERLFKAGAGRIRGTVRLPAAIPGNGIAFLFELRNATGQLILTAGFGHDEGIQLNSDGNTLQVSPIINGYGGASYARAAELSAPGVPNAFEVSWAQGEQIVILLNGQIIETKPLSSTFDASAAIPAKGWVGILEYSEVSGSTAGWSVELTDWELSP
jgi:hypothetical protein